MSDALVVATSKAILTQEALRAESEQRALLAQYIQRQMVDGTDFGKIPGTKVPTLLKPGAEKLVDLFRCTPKFHLVKIEEDFDKGFFNYVFRVRLYQRDADAVLAEGFGSANSREGRYRWRDAQRKCPQCEKATIIKGKTEYGGGWLCFAKKGGCGAKFKDGDSSIESQEQGRVENDDVATLANTILKMAKKRALVDGAIALARCSDMFTQDLEDQPPPAAAAEDDQPKDPQKSTAPAQMQSRTEQVKAKLKGQVVDVKPGETELQATERARQQVVGETTLEKEAREKREAEALKVSVALGALCKSLAWKWEKMVSVARGATGKDHVSKLTLADVETIKAAIDKTMGPTQGASTPPPH